MKIAVQDFINQIFDYKYETNIKIDIDQNYILKFLIYQITSKLSNNYIINIQKINNIIVLSTNTNVLKLLQNTLPMSSIDIQYINKSNDIFAEHEYIISINDINKIKEILLKKNIYNLEHKYNANIKINKEEFIINSDKPIIKNSIFNIRAIENNGPDKLSYAGMDKVLEKNNSLGSFLNLYKQSVSYPIIDSKSIDSILIKDNILILQLNEQAFFQSIEIFKKNKYESLVIEIDGKIYGRCMLYEIIRQQIYISFEIEDKAREMHKQLLYTGDPITIISVNNNVSNNLYKLLMLILLLCLLIYFAIKKRKYIKYIVLTSIFISLGFTFKISYLILINYITLLLIDYFLIEKENYIYYYISYIVFSIGLILFFKMNYMYNGILLHNSLYSVFFLIFNIKKNDKLTK